MEQRSYITSGWRPALIFLVSGAATGAITLKTLDYYYYRIEQRLLRLERETERSQQWEDEDVEED